MHSVNPDQIRSPIDGQTRAKSLSVASDRAALRHSPQHEFGIVVRGDTNLREDLRLAQMRTACDAFSGQRVVLAAE